MFANKKYNCEQVNNETFLKTACYKVWNTRSLHKELTFFCSVLRLTNSRTKLLLCVCVSNFSLNIFCFLIIFKTFANMKCISHYQKLFPTSFVFVFKLQTVDLKENTYRPKDESRYKTFTSVTSPSKREVVVQVICLMHLLC